MNDIMIIGAGQLGSRHLQALAMIGIPISLWVFDPSSESLKTAKQRFDEIPVNPNIKDIHYISDPESYPDNLDLVIIATTANIRFKVTEELLKKSRVKFIVFEKVLFQTIQEYESMKNLLNCYNTKAWVNCPRRMFPFYQKLHERLKNKILNIVIQGGDWGLGCNGIHFVDLLSYLTGSNSFNYVIDSLDPDLHESKRNGFIELTGVLQLSDENGNQLSLQSMQKSTAPLLVSIITDDSRFDIDEVNGKVRVREEINSWTESIEEFQLLYQSQLSHLFTHELIKTGTCSLTTFEESSLIHQGFIEAILKKMTEIRGVDQIICEIT